VQKSKFGENRLQIDGRYVLLLVEKRVFYLQTYHSVKVALCKKLIKWLSQKVKSPNRMDDCCSAAVPFYSCLDL